MRTVVGVLMNQGQVVSFADNTHVCSREGYETGKGYELCEWCDYPNHVERKVIKFAKMLKRETKGTTLHLFGHYYACEPCKEACKKAGVTINLPL